jgi:hypothetical protein
MFQKKGDMVWIYNKTMDVDKRKDDLLSREREGGGD